MKKIFYSLVITLFGTTAIYGQGCMEPSTSSAGPQIIGYFQPEFRYEFLKDQDNINSENTATWCIRRARIGVAGNIPYDFSYYVLTELSPFQNGPYILDAFVSYNRFKPWFRISMGQFKKPFGLELSTGCQDLYTINRSKVVEELTAPDRDLGIMVSGTSGAKKLFGLEKENIVSWYLSLTNGTGRNVFDGDLSKDLTGRLVIAPTEWLSIGGSYMAGKKKNPDVTVTAKDEKMRYGADIQLKKYNFILQAEYVYGEDKGSKLIGGGCGSTPELVAGNFKSNGYFAQLMYNTKWKIMPVIKYETYDPDMDLENYDHTNYSVSATTFGLNYYPNDWSRVQLNYIYKSETSSSSELVNYNEFPNDMLQLQVQVKLN
ncbi:MAG TPA: porin [Lentimicrobium sp.]|nr:porin [Lentimicrobium sp.]